MRVSEMKDPVLAFDCFGGAYWKDDGKGYTMCSRLAGIWERVDAPKGNADRRMTLKKVPADHVRFIEEALADAQKRIADLEQLRTDNEATDGTDAAHPSYWRGCDATFAAMSEQLRKILDGEDDCAGVCQEPWDSLWRRVLEQLRQQLDTAKAVGAAEWQPIETAPKDGTWILLWWGDRTVEGHWLDNSHTQFPWAGWKLRSMVVHNPAHKPTHWMPLPDPPAELRKQVQE
jgi:hypothetical protein